MSRRLPAKDLPWSSAPWDQLGKQPQAWGGGEEANPIVSYILRKSLSSSKQGRPTAAGVCTPRVALFISCLTLLLFSLLFLSSFLPTFFSFS